MRNFSKIEKEFISFLVRSERGKRNIKTFFYNQLKRTKIRFDLTTLEAEYLYEKENASNEFFDRIIKEVADVQELIAIIINLIVYLKNNGYIVPYEVTPDKWSEVHEFGQGIDKKLDLSSPFPDPEIVKLLIEYAFKEILPLEPLRDLEKHKFITPDERRFRAQNYITLFAIAVAILIGSAGILFNIISLKKQEALSIIQETNTKKAITPFVEKLDNIVGLDKKRNEDLIQLKSGVESFSSSYNKHLKRIEEKLEGIEESMKALEKNEYNKQIQPTQKPSG